MRLGIIADTHDNVPAVERAVEVFADADVDVIIHCGDYIAPPVVRYFEGFEVHGVLGNNDGERNGLRQAFEDLGNGSELHGGFAAMGFDDLRFAVLHGVDMSDVENYANTIAYDYVCYGHHHERDLREGEYATIINPGAHFPTVPDEHRTVALLDTETETVDFVNVAD